MNSTYQGVFLFDPAPFAEKQEERYSDNAERERIWKENLKGLAGLKALSMKSCPMPKLRSKAERKVISFFLVPPNPSYKVKSGGLTASEVKRLERLYPSNMVVTHYEPRKEIG